MPILLTLRRTLAIPVLAAATLGVSPPAPVNAGGGPVTYQYPSADCPTAGDHGLQDCIDGAAPGDIIHLAAEVLDGETAEIDKDLTLSGSGPTPFPRIRGLFVHDGGAGSSVDVTVKDVRINDRATVAFVDGTDHRVVLDRILMGQGSSSESSLEVRTMVPADITLRRSRIRGVDLEEADVVSLFAEDPDGVVGFHLIGNIIDAKGDPESGSGVQVAAEGDGTVRATIHNNVIHHVATCRCGASSGIAILPDGPIRMSVDVVGNTLHGFDADGIQQRNGLTGGGHLAMRVFGNVFSRLLRGIQLESGPAGTLTYQGGYNDVFASGGVALDGKPAGPGNRAVDPRFVKPAQQDFRLRPDSPLIDRMPFCPPTGVENLDAAGHGRLAGANVDLGAFERGATAPTGVARTGRSGSDTLMGTNGADILCGLGGKDVLAGLGGGDAIDGGPGDDRLFGDGGRDRLFGRDGKDLLCAKDGARGNDRSDGGPGTDRGRGDPGDATISVERSASCATT